MKGLLRDPHQNCLTVSATRESDTHPPILYMILHCSEEYFLANPWNLINPALPKNPAWIATRDVRILMVVTREKGSPSEDVPPCGMQTQGNCFCKYSFVPRISADMFRHCCVISMIQKILS